MTIALTVWADPWTGSPALQGVGFLCRCAAARSASRDAPDEATADRADVRRARDGDGEAFRRLVDRHQQRIASMMWRFSRDPVVHAELVQDVFVQAFRSLSGYRGAAPFGHWLARIATRAGYRYWRRRDRAARHPTVPLQEWDGMARQDVEAVDPSRAAAVLYEMLAALPPRDRLVLTLRYLEDCSVKETARRTGWTQSMVKVQTLRARRKLRVLFERSQGGTGDE